MTTNTKPIGVAYEDQNIIGANVVYVDSELGYTAAAQGAVTQGGSTDKTPAVTLNKAAGRITLNATALAGNTVAVFNLNNSYISANDLVIVNVSGGGTAGAYSTYISSMSTGVAAIAIRNMTAGSLSEAVIINFAIIHCV